MPTLYNAPGRAQLVRRILADNNGLRIFAIDVFCTGTYHIERHTTLPLGNIPGITPTTIFANPARCDCSSENIELPKQALELIRAFKASEVPIPA